MNPDYKWTLKIAKKLSRAMPFGRVVEAINTHEDHVTKWNANLNLDEFSSAGENAQRILAKCKKDFSGNPIVIGVHDRIIYYNCYEAFSMKYLDDFLTIRYQSEYGHNLTYCPPDYKDFSLVDINNGKFQRGSHYIEWNETRVTFCNDLRDDTPYVKISVPIDASFKAVLVEWNNLILEFKGESQIC